MRRPVLILCLLLVASTAVPQQPTLTPPYGVEERNDVDRRMREETRRKQEKALNEERQKHIKEDTDRLLKLATELKEYVNQSNEHTLSVDVVRKAEEIEKLAHDVKEKMRRGI